MREFATTHWTLVWQAAREDAEHGRPALSELVEQYWQPLYDYARRRGMSHADAEDATQEFLSRVMSGRMLEDAHPAKGRFRAFLLTAWKRFLIDQFRKDQAAKRGGQAVTVPLQPDAVARQLREPAAHNAEPDLAFMHGWAERLIAQARQRLQQDYAARNKLLLFETLAPLLTQALDRADYERLAGTLSLSTSAVKVALHRLRQRFGSMLREVVAETVEDPTEIDAELTELLNVLRARNFC